MYKALYEVSSLFPCYYNVAIVWYDKEYKRLVERAQFTAWIDVLDYAKQFNAELVFDGII